MSTLIHRALQRAKTNTDDTAPAVEPEAEPVKPPARNSRTKNAAQ